MKLSNLKPRRARSNAAEIAEKTGADYEAVNGQKFYGDAYSGYRQLDEILGKVLLTISVDGKCDH